MKGKKPLTFVITTADDIHKHAHAADLVIIHFARQDVEAGLTGPALHTLLTLSDSPELSRLYNGRLAFFFAGYDNDPREVVEIPECRRFFQQLTKEWPFWFHFVAKDVTVFHMVFALQCDVDIMKKGKSFALSFRNGQQFGALAHELFHHMNRLYELHGLPEELNRKTSMEVEDMMMKTVGGR